MFNFRFLINYVFIILPVECVFRASRGISRYTTKFSYINFFPFKIDQSFGFWAGQSLKLSINTYFCGFNSSLAVNSHVAKPERLATLENVNFNLLSFKRRPYDNDFWPISFGNLNIILGVWNSFSVNCRESYDRLFFLN